MNVPIRILIVEDSLTDFELAEREIRKALSTCTFERVETRDDFVKKLETFQPSVIVSDYYLPDFNGMVALGLAQQHMPLTPVIIWTGSLNEDIAVSCMKAGASNYVIKEHLKRLGPAVFHALQEGQVLQERSRAREALAENEKWFRALIEHGSDPIFTLNADGLFTFVSPAVTAVLGFTADELIGGNAFDLVHPGDLESANTVYAALLETAGSRQTTTARLRHKDGSWRWLEGTLTNLLAEPTIHAVIINFRDITERIGAEQAERAQRILAEALRDTAAALNNTLDYGRVFEQILSNASRVVPHDASSILIVEDGYARVVGSRGYGLEVSDEISSFRLEIAKTANLQEMANMAQPLVIADTRTYPGWHQTPATPKQRSTVGAPIRYQGTLMGFINLDSFTPNAFDQADAQHLLAFANQAAVAMRNTQLVEHMQLQLDEMRAVNTVSSALRAARTLEDTFRILMRETIGALAADSGSLWLYQEQNNELRMVAEQGWRGAPVTAVKPGEGIPGHVFATGEPYVRRELRTDTLNPQAVREQIPEGTNGACAPVRAFDEVIGVLFVTVRSPREILESEVSLLITLAEIAGTAIQRTQLFEQTRQQLDRLSALREIDLTISSSMDLRIVLNVVLEQTRTQLRVDAAAILLLNPLTNALEYGGGRGFRTREIESSVVRPGEGYAGRATLERQTIHIPIIVDAVLPFSRPLLITRENFVAYYGVPLIAKGQVKGVLEVYHRAPLASDESWLDFLEALGGQAAIAIDSAVLFDKLRRSNFNLTLAYDTTLEGWSRALDLRDHETEGHTRRVTEMTLRLAKVFAVDDAEMVNIRRGALLHDIGKMGIPDNILLKPGALTEEEWVTMRMHPVYAYELLGAITFLHAALDIPYCHHEKWDGNGYPRGLRGEEIPLSARLFAVVDVWDALRSDRPYRPGWQDSAVREYLAKQAGTQFDPAVVPVFLNLLDSFESADF